MKLITNPRDRERWCAEGSASAQFFGGSSKSSSSTNSTQNYTDARQAIQNDSHDVSNSGNSSWFQSLSDIGNTSYSSNYSSRTSNVDSGNTSIVDSRSTSTTNTDARNLSNTNSGNTSSVINYTGTDGGSVRIAELQSQLMGAMSENNIDAVKTLARMGSGIGDSAYELAAQTSANSMALSTHMLDLTGELIDKLATGTGNAVAENAAVAQSMTASATAAASSGAQMQRVMLIGGAVLLALIVLKGK